MWEENQERLISWETRRKKSIKEGGKLGGGKEEMGVDGEKKKEKRKEKETEMRKLCSCSLF